MYAHGRIAMSRQTTLFGEFVSPAKKRHLESDVTTSRKAKKVFRETWKGKAPWPQLQLLREEINDLPETWLIYKQDEGMFCKPCQKWQKVPRSGAPVWTNEPRVLLRSESLTRHSESNMHKSAIKQELDCQQASIDGGIAQSFEHQWEAEESAVKAALACVYFLASEEIPHTTKYESLMKLLSYLGLPHLDVLNKGGNAKYTSYRTVDELLTLLGDEVRQAVVGAVKASPCIGIICDETTDLSTSKELVIYAKAIVCGEVKTHLLGLKELPRGDSDAATISKSILDTIDNYRIEVQCVAAFGSDGASAMTGKSNGVAARLKQQQPSLVSIHCVGHHLALAVIEAANTVPSVKQFKSHLNSLFAYFHRSPKCGGHLEATFTQLFNKSVLKLKKPSDTACDEAFQSLKRVLDPLTLTVEDIAASEESDATAVGLAGLKVQFCSCSILYV